MIDHNIPSQSQVAAMTIPKAQPSPQPLPSNECCMCGDFGFSYELFQCQVCHFRSQHRYCSNLYPRAESYQACNWCLLLDDSKHKSHNSSDSSSSNPTSDGNGRRARVPDPAGGPVKSQRISTAAKGSGRSNLQRQLINGPIKKQKLPDRLTATPTTPRRRLISNGELEKKLRRTKSEVIAKTHNNNNGNGSGSVGGTTRHVVFRNKVRRYKLLDEVSS